MKVQYLSPLRPPRAVCESRILRQGQRISFLEARMCEHEGTLAAVAATWRMGKTGAEKSH